MRTAPSRSLSRIAVARLIPAPLREGSTEQRPSPCREDRRRKKPTWWNTGVGIPPRRLTLQPAPPTDGGCRSVSLPTSLTNSLGYVFTPERQGACRRLLGVQKGRPDHRLRPRRR